MTKPGTYVYHTSRAILLLLLLLVVVVVVFLRKSYTKYIAKKHVMH